MTFGDLKLLADARECAGAGGSSLADFAQAVVQRYAAAAPDEEWISLMGRVDAAKMRCCIAGRKARPVQ